MWQNHRGDSTFGSPRVVLPMDITSDIPVFDPMISHQITIFHHHFCWVNHHEKIAILVDFSMIIQAEGL